MSKIVVLRSLMADVQTESLIAALEAAGFEVICIESLEELMALLASEDPDEIVLVILLSINCEENSDLESAVNACAQAGARVVGIWPRTVNKEAQLPDCLIEKGSSVTTTNPASIKAAITGDTPIWEAPNGDLRPVPPLRRNKCR
ncbi:hypothetical protein [Hansschlegelia beijingensis]|uniref:Response regulatory domain-containing protein n=1 Tax=Hansschlegelia beijingensis TaxID=1133344 RepID=A0A7W6D0A0_9HYPH|nr:hypothetical protein [Hansschlegelia beijingensis]MBB3973494.1 hypothetical protein [Hansschlegelia beijingensis]